MRGWHRTAGSVPHTPQRQNGLPAHIFHSVLDERVPAQPRPNDYCIKSVQPRLNGLQTLLPGMIGAGEQSRCWEHCTCTAAVRSCGAAPPSRVPLHPHTHLYIPARIAVVGQVWVHNELW